MVAIIRISQDFSVAPALELADLAELARLGYRAVINNRLDDEETGRSDPADMRAEAERLGLVYVRVPAGKLDLFTDPVVEAMADALRTLPGPVLAHCASGTRSAIVWAAAQARVAPVGDVLAALKGAGLELSFLRDDLDAQADRARWAAPHCDAPQAGSARDGGREAA
jgi:uncharacterized protein (TIGR01244 family)